MINIAIMGHGIVGSGVVEVILANGEKIEQTSKSAVNIKKVLDLREFPDSPVADRFTKNFDDIVNDDEIKIVVECMGGINPTYDFVKRCLLAGKSVVTSNKYLVATYGHELLKIAKENNLNFLFEASVGGGIPIIRPMTQCLAANNITEITGILNGTTNFILTKMKQDGMSFKDALTMSQELGYAEKNPAEDIDGIDTCRKIAILASLAFGRHVEPESVYTKGIKDICEKDVEYAEKCGCSVKLIGFTKKLECDKINCVVYPCFVPFDNQLASVNDVFNGITVNGDAVGDVMFYGRGAGKTPTASAVVADVIDCIKHIQSRKYLYWDEPCDNYVVDHLECESKMFIRANTSDYDNALSEIKSKLDVQTVIGENSNEIAVIVKGIEKDIISCVNGIDLINVKSMIHVLD